MSSSVIDEGDGSNEKGLNHFNVLLFGNAEPWEAGGMEVGE